MHLRRTLATIALLATAAAPAGPPDPAPANATPAVATPAKPALPSSVLKARTELGHRLFYDADLSADGSMSCATCHEQRHAFSDGNPTHPGVTDEPAIRNVPTLGNVGDLHTLTWIDQHVTPLEQQFYIPVMGHRPVEMGMSGTAELERRIAKSLCYRTLFRRAFPRTAGRIDTPSIAAAIASFERTLITRDSPWDAPGHSLTTATPAQQRGDTLFFGKARCGTCHTPPLFTDQKFYTIDPRHPARIRTPSLRNIAVTGPWLHDGTAPTPEAAIEAHHTLPPLTPSETSDIAAFLSLLTDTRFLTSTAFSLPPESCDP